MSSQSTIKEPQKFCFPLRDLENDRILLSVFDPDVHAAQYIAATLDSAAEIHRYLPIPPLTTTESFIDLFWNGLIANDPGSCVYAIFDKASNKFAGTIGFLHSSPEHLKTEIGYIITVPEFRRTHVASNAIGLLMHYALDLPENGGLGLRRLQWQSDSRNQASIRVAEKMGFVKEGVARWDRVLAPHIESSGEVTLRKGDPRAEVGGRHSVMLAMCWDDWEGGGRERVDKIMAR